MEDHLYGRLPFFCLYCLKSIRIGNIKNQYKRNDIFLELKFVKLRNTIEIKFKIMNILEIKNLHATIENKEILKGINLCVKPGEIHAIMGPNGSGKSTLASVIAGNPSYIVTEGSVIFNGKNLLSMLPEQRSHEGLFLSFQYPVEIPGVSNVNFMKAAVNEHRKHKGDVARSSHCSTFYNSIKVSVELCPVLGCSLRSPHMYFNILHLH